MMRIWSHVRGHRTVVPRLRRVSMPLLVALEFVVHPTELVAQLIGLFVKHVNLVAKLLVLVAAGAAVFVEVTDVVGRYHHY